MGTVLMGKHDTPYKIATGKLDIFGDTSADYNNIVANISVNGVTAGFSGNAFDLRPGNVLAYITPTFNGIQGAIAYVFGNEVGNGALPNQSAWSAMGMYDNGPIFASLAYEQHTNLTAAGEDRHAWKLGAGYNFGDGQVGFIYEDAQNLVGVGGIAQNRKAYYLNGQYNMGNIALKAAYGHAGKLDTIADSGANTYSLGVDYNLSKRSRLYAQYTKTNNDTNGMYGLGAGQGSSYTPAAGTDPSVFSIGMRHTF
jgi:predicted porin